MIQTIGHQTATSASGYLHPQYAQSLAEYGTPRFLSRSGGWLLNRKIPDSSLWDGMGCYPLFACRDWTALREDVDDLSGELVSVALVADPFGNHTSDLLRSCFKDVVLPFKQHFVVDLSKAPAEFVASHHQRNARKAAQIVSVEACSEPTVHEGEWTALYDVLMERHAIRGIQAFSPRSFSLQLQIPGMVMFRATRDDTTVGMILWYIQGDVGYYHLGAYSLDGYNLRVSFAMFWFAIEYFTELGLKWLNLGAGAGVNSESEDGLTRFKRGWSTGTRTAYFCGRILDDARYDELVRMKGVERNGYFPAYRNGEFG
jgi:GNAT acetyltransferase-like protein